MSTDRIDLGDVVAAHGVAGWLRLRLFNPQGRTLHSIGEVELACGDARLTLPLERVKPHRGFALVKLGGVNRMEEAQRLVGFRLSAPRDALAPPGPSEYYYQEVVGFEVRGADGERIGTVTGVWPRQDGDLLVVAGSGKEHLIPAVKEFVRQVDLVNGTVTVDAPDGLLEL